MKTTFTLALTATLSLLSTASAATINKARQTYPVPVYTVSVTTSDSVTDVLISDASGQVFDSFNPSITFLTSATIYNPADNVQCIVRDSQGNQVRAFGGPSQFVDSIELVPADGKQVFSLACAPAF